MTITVYTQEEWDYREGQIEDLRKRLDRMLGHPHCHELPLWAQKMVAGMSRKDEALCLEGEAALSVSEASSQDHPGAFLPLAERHSSDPTSPSQQGSPDLLAPIPRPSEARTHVRSVPSDGTATDIDSVVPVPPANEARTHVCTCDGTFRNPACPVHYFLPLRANEARQAMIDAPKSLDRADVLDRYQRAFLRLWELFPSDPLGDDPAHFYIERLEALLDKGLLVPRTDNPTPEDEADGGGRIDRQLSRVDDALAGVRGAIRETLAEMSRSETPESRVPEAFPLRAKAFLDDWEGKVEADDALAAFMVKVRAETVEACAQWLESQGRIKGGGWERTAISLRVHMATLTGGTADGK